VQGAKLYVEKMRNIDKKNDQDLAAQIEQGYYTVLVAERNYKLLEQNLTTLEKTFFETTELFKNGFAEESSVDQLSLLVTNSKTAIDKAKRQAEITKNVLKFQMGYPMEKDIQLTENLESLWLLNNHDALMSSKFDVTKNINHYLANIEVTLNDYLVKIEKAKYLPTGTAFVNYQTNAQRNEFDFFDRLPWYQSAFWGVGIKMPIFDSFQKAAAVKNSKLNLQRIKDTQVFTEQQLKLEESTARSNYISAFEQLRAEEANIKLAEKIRNKTVIKFNEGVANSSELTQTETQLLSTQGAYINSLFQLLNAKAELNKILTTY
jgi:outer membrane protein TolC